MAMELNVSEIVALQARYVGAWHEREIAFAETGILGRIAREHECNFRLWHIEDEARRRDVGDDYIAAQKRAIDEWNQKRNDAIEAIDEALIEAWPWIAEPNALPLNTEPAGAAVDRLSIAALKIFHMAEQTARRDVDEAHRARCREKLAILERQRDDLAVSLDRLLLDLQRRRKRLQVYRQFKMYNDPALNPAVYGSKTPTGDR